MVYMICIFYMIDYMDGLYDLYDLDNLYNLDDLDDVYDVNDLDDIDRDLTYDRCERVKPELQQWFR